MNINSSLLLRYTNAFGWHRILIAFVVIWLTILFFALIPMLGSVTSFSSVSTSLCTDSNVKDRLTKALTDLEFVEKQNRQLQQLFKDISFNSFDGDKKTILENFETRLNKVSNYGNDNEETRDNGMPSTEYELLRRRINRNIKELWNFLDSSLNDLRKRTAENVDYELSNQIDYIRNLGNEHKRSLLYDMDRLSHVDGYESWRQAESKRLTDTVQDRFRRLQNPEDCTSAKKLICNLNKGCGYGCQLHHLVYCFMVAYGTERTLIVKSKGWRYHKAGWEEVFKPLSDTCTDPSGESIANWPGNGERTQVLNLPIIDSLSPRPPFLPLAVPEDLADQLTRLHGDPIVWWVGQILKFILRPQKKTEQLTDETMQRIGFQKPIVGVHVRRTDKVGTEAAYHSIEEYMTAVDEYYNQLELRETVLKRRIYLATDDPKVIAEAQNKYPHYEILADPSISKTAAISTRYSDVSLNGIINDINMLSMCDYLVCTFSSQVCRIAYELMQNFYVDASDRYRSLDDIYYYGGQNPHNVVAVLPHKAKRNGEMNVKVGDVIGVAGNHWNGFSKGRNLRTNQIALYPTFKVNDRIETAKFPTYDKQ